MSYLSSIVELLRTLELRFNSYLSSGVDAFELSNFLNSCSMVAEAFLVSTEHNTIPVGVDGMDL